MKIADLKTYIRNYCKKNKLFYNLYKGFSLFKTNVLRILPDDVFLRYKFRVNTGEKLNLKDPQTFNMKLQWLKLNDRNPLYTSLADKYAVRKYVENRAGGAVLNELYGVYSSTEEINTEKLPDKFVLKCTHDCGSIVICDDKKNFDKKSAVKFLNAAMKRNYFWNGREWPYKNIKPRIIAEKYLQDDSGELMDYKVFCFSGIPRVIQVDYDRFTDHHRNLYDTDWNYLGYTNLYPTNPSHMIERPECLEELIAYARMLSENIPFVRVDFYIVNNKPIFGEMTFYHDGGMGPFKPKEWDIKLGNWIKLSF